MPTTNVDIRVPKIANVHIAPKFAKKCLCHFKLLSFGLMKNNIVKMFFIIRIYDKIHISENIMLPKNINN